MEGGGLINAIFDRNIKNQLLKSVPNLWNVDAESCFISWGGSTVPLRHMAETALKIFRQEKV